MNPVARLERALGQLDRSGNTYFDEIEDVMAYIVAKGLPQTRHSVRQAVFLNNPVLHHGAPVKRLLRVI